MALTYKLSSNAALHLSAIVDYTDATFGEQQTARYVAGLKKSFELLAEFPGIGRADFEIKQGLRRFTFQSHHIYYTEHANHILVEAILHVRQLVRKDLFDDV